MVLVCWHVKAYFLGQYMVYNTLKEYSIAEKSIAYVV